MNAMDVANAVLAGNVAMQTKVSALVLAQALMDAVEGLNVLSAISNKDPDAGMHKVMTEDGAAGYGLAMRGVKHVVDQTLAKVRGDNASGGKDAK